MYAGDMQGPQPLASQDDSFEPPVEVAHVLRDCAYEYPCCMNHDFHRYPMIAPMVAPNEGEMCRAPAELIGPLRIDGRCHSSELCCGEVRYWSRCSWMVIQLGS